MALHNMLEGAECTTQGTLLLTISEYTVAAEKAAPVSDTPQHWAFGMDYCARPNLVSVRVDFAGLETFVKTLLLEESKPDVQVI